MTDSKKNGQIFHEDCLYARQKLNWRKAMYINNLLVKPKKMKYWTGILTLLLLVMLVVILAGGLVLGACGDMVYSEYAN